MSNVITNQDAAKLAQVIYQIQNDKFTRATVDLFKDKWDLSKSDDVIKGASGTLFVIKKETGFAIVAKGKGQEFKNDILLVFRGTDNTFDWATDATVGFSPSRTGRFVHTGFNKCFSTVLPELEKKLQAIEGRVRTIHCVGHSLGGALATLAAEWLKKSKVVIATDIKLYTFGSPRVGASSFVHKFTQDMSEGDDIYRVYHKTDVVPMVPIWPFYHVPEKSPAFCLDSPGSMPSGHYHKMAQYVSTVSKSTSWETMSNLEPVVSTAALEHWLSSDGPLSFTINTMNMIHKAIAYVVKKVLKLAAISVQFGIASGVTLLDLLAYVLKKGIDFSKETSVWVYCLIKRIMVALGLKFKKDIEMTAAFIRHVFTLLKQKIDRLVKVAVDSIFE
jgi:triacylglycerol lipase